MSVQSIPQPLSRSSRLRGALLGLAVCDALGGPVEFKARHSFPWVKSLLPNDNFGLPPGCFTDDTSMALCLAQSLLDNRGNVDVADQVSKYNAWWQSGYMSSTGACFDIGVSTRSTLAMWAGHMADNHYSSLQPDSAAARQIVLDGQRKINAAFDKANFCGNGSLMRVLPVALLARDLESAQTTAILTSQPTHPHQRCSDGCAIYTTLVYEALQGRSKAQLAAAVSRVTVRDPVTAACIVAPYASLGDWARKPESEISSSGYVVHALEAALWAFFRSDSFADGAMAAVNLGDDADTVAAIYGGLAGAFYGIDAIPPDWRVGMRRMDLLDRVAQSIVAFSP